MNTITFKWNSKLNIKKMIYSHIDVQYPKNLNQLAAVFEAQKLFVEEKLHLCYSTTVYINTY